MRREASDDDEAAAWAIRLDAGDALTGDEAHALDRWLEDDPARAGALLRAEAVLAFLDRGHALAAEPPPASIDRRRAIGWTGAAALAAAATIWGMRWVPTGGQRLATGIGEIRRVPLGDGSVASLNTRSVVVVALKPDRRDVSLVDGEAWFQVAHDRTRPFVVAAGDARVRAVGTAFSIRRRDGGTQVLVTEGVVEAWREGAAAAPVRIAAGERGWIADTPPPAGVSAVRKTEAPQDVERMLAWRNGELALNGETLAEAVADINRYNRLQLEVDRAIAGERLVGYFRTDDPARFAGAVADMVGGRTERDGDRIRIAAAAR